MLISSLLCRLEREDEAAEWIDIARRLSPASDVATLAGVDYVEAILLARRGELDRGAGASLGTRSTRPRRTDFWAHARPLARGRRRGHGALGRRVRSPHTADEARAVYAEKGIVVEVDRLDALAEL